MALCIFKMYVPKFKSILLVKNVKHHLRLQEVVIFLLVEGLASVLMSAG